MACRLSEEYLKADYWGSEIENQSKKLALREEIDRSSMFEEIVGCSEALRRVLA